LHFSRCREGPKLFSFSHLALHVRVSYRYLAWFCPGFCSSAPARSAICKLKLKAFLYCLTLFLPALHPSSHSRRIWSWSWTWTWSCTWTGSWSSSSSCSSTCLGLADLVLDLAWGLRLVSSLAYDFTICLACCGRR